MQQPAATLGSAPAKLLVRGVNWLGDAVMTTPALQRLRERFPRANITLLTQSKLAGLWEPHPCVDAVLTSTPSEGLWSVARRLRQHAFESALIFPNSPRSALETWLAGIPHRVGYATAWRSWFLTEAIKHPATRVSPRRLSEREVQRKIQQGTGKAPPAGAARYEHQMHDYLRLVATLGCNPAPVPPKLQVTQSEVEAALANVAGLAERTKLRPSEPAPTWLGINASAAYGPAKCWPMERFAAVARQVSQAVPKSLWLSFGTESDWELGERLSRLAGVPILNLAGKTSLRQLMALLSTCRVLLSNDSGPMHVAAALGTPVVVPFGSTSPELTAPGEPGDPRHHLLTSGVPCSPCFRRTCPIDFRCMTSVTVEQVVSAVITSLKSNPVPVSHRYP